MRLGICASLQGLAQLEPLLALGELEAVAVPAQLLQPNRPELIHGAEGQRPLLEQHWPQLELLQESQRESQQQVRFDREPMTLSAPAKET